MRRKETETILSEVRSLREAVSDGLNAINSRLSNCEDRLKWLESDGKSTAKHCALNSEAIRKLSERIDKIVESGKHTVWEDASRAALDRSEVKRAATYEHMSFRDALQALDSDDRLQRSGDGRLTRPVRSKRNGKVVRAVMIIKQEGNKG